jgi:heme-degrading monooxygenase HmoA
VYTIVTRRKYNPGRMQETIERARSEMFPKMQRAPGFVGFYLVNDPDNGINTAVIVWQDKASAEAFQAEGERWGRVLEEMGHSLESDNRGETVVSVEGQA